MVRGGICARLSAPVSYEQPMTITRDFALDAKYRREEGLIFLSGIQALVRLPLDQHRADRRRGLNTATLISGYRGSPLGGLDLTLERNPDLLREHNVVFISGLNEDLGATAIYGSQLANLFPRPRYDGVLGMWYGKGPGVDRTGDIFKHANFAGVARHGGVLALGGADPGFEYDGRPWQQRQNPLLMPPWGLDTEREIHYGRLEAARAFARVNRLNRITLDAPNAWLGIAAPGKTYYDLREALRELGLD